MSKPFDVSIDQLARCFEGVIPGVLTSASADGTPNVMAVSYVHRIDDRHVALSRQFFKKTHANLAENPKATVSIIDPSTYRAYRLTLRFEREETEGPLFDSMAARIDAIASMTGMRGIFQLRASSVFEVCNIREMDGFSNDPLRPPRPVGKGLETIDALTQLRVLRRITDVTAAGRDAADLVDAVLAILDEVLGFEHTMILVLDETGERLFTLASRGYRESGAGAEVNVGDGVIGIVARDKKLMRISSMKRARLYARALGASVGGPGAREIPLPGLPDSESQLVVPLLVGKELFGVLAVESREQIRYGEREEAFLEIVAGHIALGLHVATREAEGLVVEGAKVDDARPRHTVVFYESDDCIFVDGEYLVRNVPGRILWKLLEACVGSGRVDFTNRELRLDASLALPAIRSNLESRLILLRKRLEERCPNIRIVSTGRGRFRLEIEAILVLEKRP